MTDRTCVTGCGRPTADFLCASCLGQLLAALRELTGGNGGLGLLAELDITLSRQDVLAAGNPVGHRTDAPLPFRPEVSAIASAAANTITTWARDLHEHNPHLRPPAGTPTDAARWLAGWPSLLALHPAADELHTDITGLTHQIRYHIDHRPDRVHSGPCGAPTDTGPCPGHLYARAGAGMVTCPACGADHDVAERRAWMTDRARDTLLTAPVALGWARLLLDHEIRPGTWRSWLSRRRVLPRATDRFGRNLYRFGDVVDLVADHLRRRHAA
jgi:hypothetical protein